jgi:hypothetical protein
MAGVTPTIKFTASSSTATTTAAIADPRPTTSALAPTSEANGSKMSAVKSWFSSISFHSPMNKDQPSTTTPVAAPVDKSKKAAEASSSVSKQDAADSPTKIFDDIAGKVNSDDQHRFFPVEENVEESTSISRSVSASSGSGSASSSDSCTKINVSFKPSSELALSTVERVRGRLQAYKSLDDLPTEEHPSTSSSSSTNAINLARRKEKVLDVVVYYYSCMVSKMPGTMYLTPYYLAFTSGWALAQYREMIPIIELDSVNLVPANSAFIPSNTIKLTFFGGKKEIFVTPLAVEASRVRMILMDAIHTFLKR